MQVAKLRASMRGKTRHFSVWAERPATVGRSSKCTVRLNDPTVSRLHCELAFRDGKIVITDLGSSHGLVYRGQTFKTFALEIGDGFHVGETFIRFDGIDLNSEAPEPLAATLPPGTPIPTAARPAAPVDRDDENDDEEDDDSGGWADDDDPQPPADRWIAPPPPPGTSAAASDYPSVAPARKPRSRRKKPNFLVQVIGWLLAFVMTVAATIAVLLFVKDKYGWDVYSLTGWLRETLHSDEPPPTKR